MAFDRNARDPVRVRRALQELAKENALSFNEAPAGTINGTNPTFALQNAPVAGTLILMVNGLTQLQGSDYTVSGNTVTFLTASIPQPGDWLRATYEA